MALEPSRDARTRPSAALLLGALAAVLVAGVYSGEKVPALARRLEPGDDGLVGHERGARQPL